MSVTASHPISQPPETISSYTEIVTFDVFDTALTRLVGSPVSSFLLLGNKLRALSLINCSAEVFARLRADAERRAFRNAGGLDSNVNTYQIYAELQTVLKLDEKECAQLVHHELELEQFLLQPVPTVKQLVNEARNRKARVVYISDMYLGCEFIKKQLIRHGLFQEGDGCYVSCDYKKSKHTGELFWEVLRTEKAENKQFTHTGNDVHSDVKVGKRVGIHTNPFLQGNLNRYERILENDSWSTEGLSSAMAGASRLSRLSIPVASAKERALRDVSAGVAAPLLTGFVLWVLKRAQKLQLRRLYFVSRDGQILLEIARKLAVKLDYACELRYLYGSRQAWVLPSVVTLNEENLKRVLYLEAHFISVYAALDRVSIKPEEIRQYLLAIGIPEDQWSRNLNNAERDKLRQMVQTEKQIQDLIYLRAGQQREVMIEYLEQEGLLEPIPFGMIDLGTTGTLHKALSEVLKVAGGNIPTSFYLGFRHPSLEEQYGRLESYFYDYRNNTGYDAPGVVEMLEIVCSGDHGSVLSYRREGDKVVPLLKEEVNQMVLEWGYRKVAETISFFSQTLLLDPQLINPWTDVRKATLKALEAFWSRPTSSEAAAWGSFMMEDGWGEAARMLRVADQYQWKHVLWVLQNRRLQLRKHWWPGGAIALTSPLLQPFFKGIVAVGEKVVYLKPKLQKRTKFIRLKYQKPSNGK